MIDDDPRIDPADLRGVRFPGSRKRYEAPAVDQFLESLVDRISATNALVDDLRRRLAAAENSAPSAPAETSSPFEKPDLSALSDDELVGLVGSETAHVLSTARRAAEEIRSKAEESAARVIREATTEARQTVDDAETKAASLLAEAETARADAVAEAQASVAEMRAAAADEVDATVAAARQRADEIVQTADAAREAADADADRIRAEARDEGRTMVNEAKAVRGRVLDDLQRRRSLARTQIETLLAGRERLLEAYERVRGELDASTAELEAAGPELHDHDDAADDALIASLTADEADESDDDAVEVAADEPEVERVDDVALDDADEPVVDDVVEAGAEVAESPPADEGDTDEVVAEDVIDDDDDDDVDDDADEDAGDEGEAVDETSAVSSAVEPVVETPEAPEPELTDDSVDAPAEEPDIIPDGDGEEPRDVDALFARIRAERAESVARAQRVLSGGSAVEATAEVPAETSAQAPDASRVEPEPEPEPDVDVDVDADVGTDVDAGAEADVEGAEDVAVGDVDAVPSELLASEPSLERRAEVIDRLDGQLSRALKRHLADEQNGVLDGLRRSQSTAIDDLLPPSSEHTAGYAAVAGPILAEAAAAGASEVDATAKIDVDELAAQLGAALVEPFRRRLERAADEVEGDADELDERLRAVYREWKVSHIGAATTDALLSAYARGQLGAAPASATLRWLIDPAQGPCPDAQDNALAGGVAAGETFPTGDACPQAHPGCRCLLVVDS